VADPSRRSPNGVDKGTVDKYRAYIRNDVDEIFGSIPLTALTHIDVAQWVQRLQLPNARGKIPSAKTVTNKHGFVAGALNAAVSHNPPIIPANPCTGLGMPNDDDHREMIFLTREQFALLHSR
jgi:integrase